MNAKDIGSYYFLRWVIVCCVFVFVWDNPAASLFGDEDNGSGFSIKVKQNGEVILDFNSGVSEKYSNKYFTRFFNFGMPGEPADKNWQEDGVLFLEWIRDNIVYTMSVFCCPGIEDAAGKRGKWFVVVKIHGENLNAEYKDAKAGFSVKVGGKSASFDFNDGIVKLKMKDGELSLAAVDVPTGCAVNKKDGFVEFSGSMPPGTTGFMVFKIPVIPDLGKGRVAELLNLDFEDCLKSYRKTWKSSESSKWNIKDGIYYQDF
ncbi:MAG: hypothetical protein N2487_01125 [Verrucomicrobiae bacterium]|nr:hypothetical protein [Verrucomicrobiae bacterium]